MAAPAPQLGAADLYDRLKTIPDFNAKELAWDFEQEKQAMEELTHEDRENWVKYHLPRERQWFRIADHLLREEAPELMAVMFDGVDKLQHQAWLYVDPNQQSGELSEYHKRMRVLCLDYFRQLDGFIEKLVTAAGPEVQVFLASDHGFTATTEVVRINAYLHEKGYLNWKEVPDTDAGRRREDSMFAFLDWQNTIAYCRTPSSNGINIRVARNPGETGVAPEQYEALRKRLIRDLEDLKDPVSGERIITEIHLREDVFPGEAMHDAPDLLLVLRDFGFVSIKNKLPVVRAAHRDRRHAPSRRRVPGVWPGHLEGRDDRPAAHHRRLLDPALQPGPRGAVRFRGRGAAGDVHRRATRAPAGRHRRIDRGRDEERRRRRHGPGREGADHGPAAAARLHGVTVRARLVRGSRARELSRCFSRPLWVPPCACGRRPVR